MAEEEPRGTDRPARQADLAEAHLSRANVAGAHLTRADLPRANLAGAHLSGANLIAVNLGGANLSSADLAGAYLWTARLHRTGLKEADFRETNMGATSFGDTDLSKAKNLDSVKHLGPSIIGIDTIYRSQGDIPEVFLRGAGVPEEFITYMRSLVGQPIQFYSCFISYSTRDQAFADRLYADLQARNVRCWLATEDLKIGDRFRMRIDEEIRLHDKLLLVLSETSIRSAWVASEVEAAFEKERKTGKTVLFPIRLDDAVMETDEAWAAEIRRTRHIGGFRKWKDHDAYQKALDRLLRDLREASAQPKQST